MKYYLSKLFKIVFFSRETKKADIKNFLNIVYMNLNEVLGTICQNYC